MAKKVELTLKEGDKAPEIDALDNTGGRVSLKDFKANRWCSIFIPGTTPRDAPKRPALSAMNTPNSKRPARLSATDPVKSHQKFIEKFSLPFQLLADEDKKIVEVYGVWGEKSFMGRKYMGTNRVTFLIGPDGRIAKIWPEVKPEQHAGEVLAAIKAL